MGTEHFIFIEIQARIGNCFSYMVYGLVKLAKTELAEGFAKHRSGFGGDYHPYITSLVHDIAQVYVMNGIKKTNRDYTFTGVYKKDPIIPLPHSPKYLKNAWYRTGGSQ